MPVETLILVIFLYLIPLIFGSVFCITDATDPDGLLKRLKSEDLVEARKAVRNMIFVPLGFIGWPLVVIGVALFIAGAITYKTIKSTVSYIVRVTALPREIVSEVVHVRKRIKEAKQLSIVKQAGELSLVDKMIDELKKMPNNTEPRRVLHNFQCPNDGRIETQIPCVECGAYDLDHTPIPERNHES